MTILHILTNDDWWGLFTIGILNASPLFTYIFIISMIYIINYLTFGLVFAILLDGFSKLPISNN